MSAHDLALLSQHIINDFPDQYQIYSQKEFSYNGIKQINVFDWLLEKTRHSNNHLIFIIYFPSNKR